MKKIKWYAKMSFWQFIGYVVAPLSVTGEGAIIALDLSPWLHGVVFIAVVISGFVKFYAKDENNNGIVDAFEK